MTLSITKRGHKTTYETESIKHHNNFVAVKLVNGNEVVMSKKEFDGFKVER